MNQIQSVVSKVVANEKTPVVLTVVACTGVIATGVMSYKAGIRAQQILGEKDPELPFRKKAKITWKYYAPAVGVAGVTILAVVAMNRVTAKKAAILTAGATLATNTLQEYQQHVLEEIGAERESKIRNRIAKKKVAESDLVSAEAILITGDECLCYDTYSGQYFKGSAEDIREAENSLNREIIHGVSGFVSLNDWYREIGAEENQVGELVGFNIDNLIDIHFAGDILKEKTPVLAITFINVPIENFQSFS